MRAFRHHHAFTLHWFQSSHWWMLPVFNAPIIGRWLRRQLGLVDGGRVVDVRPDSIVLQFNETDFQYVGWTGDVVSQFVYELAKPLWWAIHYWDELIADRWIPQWSYGFNALDNRYGGNEAGPPLLRRFTDSDNVTTNAWDLSISCVAPNYTAARNGQSTDFNVWRGGVEGATPPPLQVSVTAVNLPSVAIYRSFLHFNTSAMAGNRGQIIPGRLTVTWASVLVVPEASGSFSPGNVVLCQSTIAPTKTTSQVVGSDYQQTPVSAAIDLATTRENGTRSQARDANNALFALIPGQNANTNGGQPLYQWILKSGDSSTLTEIESYYYPPAFGSYGAHNGLGRFCLRSEFEFLNQSTTTDRINLIRSRERAEAQSTPSLSTIFYTPRLMVNYTITGEIVDVLSFKGTNAFGQSTDQVTQFGLATISAPRTVSVRSITKFDAQQQPIPLTQFGTPNVPANRQLSPPSMPLFTRIGVPTISSIFAQGFSNPAQFGSARVISPIRPPSITRNGSALIAFGSARVESGPTVYAAGFKVREEGTITQPGRFGLARVDTGLYRINALSILPAVQFGLRAVIGHPFPDQVYVSRLQDLPLQYQIVAHEYDGGRIETNVQVCGVRQWRLEYDGLSEADLAILVEHFNKVQGRVGLFPFYHRRDNVAYSDCRYAGFEIPARIKKWSNAVTIVIEREE